MQEMHKAWVWSLGQEEPLEEEMATSSSIPAWEVPRTEPAGHHPRGCAELGTASDPRTRAKGHAAHRLRQHVSQVRVKCGVTAVHPASACLCFCSGVWLTSWLVGF